MGRDIETIAQWQGRTAEVRALLESTEIILRGGISERVPRDRVTSLSVDQGWLRLTTDRGALVLELGEVEASRWLAALQKPVPTLAQKLGVSPGCLAFIYGQVTDAVLAAALRDVTCTDLAGAGLIVAVLAMPGDLEAALGLALSAPGLAIWCVYPKGRAAVVSDSMVRTCFRDRGYIDSKTCAVSDVLTATRYGLRRG